MYYIVHKNIILFLYSILYYFRQCPFMLIWHYRHWTFPVQLWILAPALLDKHLSKRSTSTTEVAPVASGLHLQVKLFGFGWSGCGVIMKLH